MNEIYVNMTYLMHKHKRTDNKNVFAYRILHEIEKLAEDNKAFASSDT